ncbi:MAG: methyltransferase domain-containing protein [Elusimicrobia bacterium]|nr:methyltransferase domain-containing protein [Elusimicrobiota bacterium]
MRTHDFTDFNKLAELVLSYRRAKPMLVALHYDLFSEIAKGRVTAASLAAELELDAPALERLLDALCAIGWLEKRGRRYRNTRAGRRLLVETSPEYVGSNLKYQEHTWDAWSDLRYVIKEGKPRRGLLDWIRKDFFTADYIKAMGDVTRHPARELAEKLDWTGVARTLDVGSGAGTFSAAFVEKSPSAVAVLLDLPKPLAVAKSLLKRHPGADRFRFKPADYLADSLGENEYDLVLISNVSRVEDEKSNRLLVAKAHRALKKGGRLIIHDYALDPDRTSPLFPALMSLHVLLFTGKGRAYTAAEYEGWLRGAGFKALSGIPIAKESLHPSLAVVGRKA